MKGKCKILCSILFYVLLLSWAMDFQVLKLFDVKLFLQLVIGTVLLTLPFSQPAIRKMQALFSFIFYQALLLFQ